MQNNTLSHMHWLGGSPCSGKSTITALLAERHDIAVYHVDDALYQRPERIDHKHHPALATWMAASCDERWLKPIDVLLTDAIACYTEHFSLILEDLRDRSAKTTGIIEGTALLPHLVADLGIDANKALWQVPMPAFQMKHYRQRPWVKPMLSTCSDPEQAFNNWMERDSQFARWIAQQATDFGYTVYRIDESDTVDECFDRVANFFGFL